MVCQMLIKAYHPWWDNYTATGMRRKSRWHVQGPHQVIH